MSAQCDGGGGGRAASSGLRKEGQASKGNSKCKGPEGGAAVLEHHGLQPEGLPGHRW